MDMGAASSTVSGNSSIGTRTTTASTRGRATPSIATAVATSSSESAPTTRVRATPLLAPIVATPVRPAPMSDLSAQEAGARVLAMIVEEVGRPLVDRYFGAQASLRLTHEFLEISVPSSFMSDMLERRFGHLLRAFAAQVLADLSPNTTSSTASRSSQSDPKSRIEIRFRVDRSILAHAAQDRPTSSTSAAAAAPRSASAGSTPAAAPAAPPASAAPWRAAPRPTLQHRLDDFVVGLSNRLAYAGATRMADEDGPCAPLFVHGPSGVGKTHLLQGLAARFTERRPGAVVRYISAEAFTNEFITAVRAGKIDAFRKLYRKVDLLCIDDVHFFSNKDATQSELLFTLDAVGLEGSRLALASDEHPREIQKLSERLLSRFLAGAVVRVDTPDPALREKLVKLLAQRRGVAIDEPAMALLVERSARGPSTPGVPGAAGGSVREIEGLVNQIDAMRRVLPELLAEDGRVGLTLVRKALGLDGPTTGGNVTRTNARLKKPISVELVISEVCRHLCVDLHAFMGKGRHKRVVLARSMVASLSRRLTTMSFPEIARIMGRTNHSTVITAQKRIDTQMATESGGLLEQGLVPGWNGSAKDLAQHLSDQVQKAAAGN
jgi:chromosomal replication initiator protein